MKSSKPLQNLKTLVTRPAHQAKHLCELIKKAGGEAILFPTIEIADPSDKTSLQNAIQQLEDFDIAIFTSANAVQKVLPFWPKKTLPLIIAAIGPATTKVLAKNHLRVTILPKTKFNSEALLDHSALQQITNKKIVIFTGEGGRGLLAEELLRRGAEVFNVIVYRRVKPAVNFAHKLSNWQKMAIDIIISTSNESLQNLLEMAGDKYHQGLMQIPLLVVSLRAQEYAENLGFQKIITATDATDKAILAAIKKWYSNKSARKIKD